MTLLYVYCSLYEYIISIYYTRNWVWAPRHEGVLGELMYSSTHSLISALDGGECSVSRPGRFTPKERAPGTHWIGGWVGPKQYKNNTEHVYEVEVGNTEHVYEVEVGNWVTERQMRLTPNVGYSENTNQTTLSCGSW
jgi:hypothetical protein